MARFAHADDNHPAGAFQQGMAGTGEIVVQPLPQFRQGLVFARDYRAAIGNKRGFGHAGKLLKGLLILRIPRSIGFNPGYSKGKA
jgi:hypothetical protein